jgi:hypothetical protein
MARSWLDKSPVSWLPVAWSIVVAIALFWAFHAQGYDDPYITYRYAANLAAGHGFVYNSGEHVLSTTTPLYTLLLAAAGVAGLDIPLTSNALGCLGLALGGLAFWELGRAWHTPSVGLTGLLLYPLFPFTITTLGAETTIYVALILFGFLACARGRYQVAAVLLALATLTRADGIVAAGAAGLYVLLFARPLPWRALLIYCALLAPWFVFAWAYFGAPLPVTLAAKQQQGQMAISRSFLAGLAVQANGYWNNLPYRLAAALAAVGLVAAVVRWRHWLVLLGWNILYAAGYTLLGVSGYFWYYAPLVAGLVALVGLGVAAVRQLIARAIGTRGSVGVATALILAMMLIQIRSLAHIRETVDSRLAIYRSVGLWLHEHTASDASVGTLEVGIIGYYAQRRMIDFAGLIQPETATHLTHDATYEDAARWAVVRFQPSYIVVQNQLFPQLEADSAFQARCRTGATFSDPGYPSLLSVYRCLW